MITTIAIILSIGAFALYRNHWVYTKRVDLIWNDPNKYDKLKSYEYMFYRFWVFNVDKFIK